MRSANIVSRWLPQISLLFYFFKYDDYDTEIASWSKASAWRRSTFWAHSCMGTNCGGDLSSSLIVILRIVKPRFHGHLLQSEAGLRVYSFTDVLWPHKWRGWQQNWKPCSNRRSFRNWWIWGSELKLPFIKLSFEWAKLSEPSFTNLVFRNRFPFRSFNFFNK